MLLNDEGVRGVDTYGVKMPIEGKKIDKIYLLIQFSVYP